jgi:two-component system sensor histidine kinase DesK
MFSPLEYLNNARRKMKNKGASLFWLIYTVFLFVDPAFNPSLRHWIGTLVVFAVFLVVYYVYSVSCSKRWRYGMVGIIFLLGALSVP